MDTVLPCGKVSGSHDVLVGVYKRFCVVGCACPVWFLCMLYACGDILNCVSKNWWSTLALYGVFTAYGINLNSEAGNCAFSLNIKSTYDKMLSVIVANGVT